MKGSATFQSLLNRKNFLDEFDHVHSVNILSLIERENKNMWIIVFDGFMFFKLYVLEFFLNIDEY